MSRLPKSGPHTGRSGKATETSGSCWKVAGPRNTAFVTGSVSLPKSE